MKNNFFFFDDINSIKYLRLSLQYYHDNNKNNILKLEDFRRDTLEGRNF